MIKFQGIIWFIYILVKFAHLSIAYFFISEVTTLGDTFRYLEGPKAWQNNWFYNSTVMMDSVASFFEQAMGGLLANVPFLILAFLGVYYPISKLKLGIFELIIILVFLSFPSFGIWTSIASKEAVSVFFMGVILAAYIDCFRGARVRNKFLLLFSVYLCLVFKPQYLIGIFFLFLFTYFSRIAESKASVKLLLFFFIVAAGLLALYLFRDLIDSLSMMMPGHFSQDASSTRVNTIWVEKYDFFKNAVYGIYIAFVGPTVQEALSRPLHMLVWIESFVIVLSFFMCVLNYSFVAMLRLKVNFVFVCGFSLVAFWILFVHYPFGALNPGSANRYREAFYAFLVCLFFFMYREAMAASSRKLNNQVR